MHLIVDGYCSNKELLADGDKLRLWMAEITKVLGLLTFGEPRVLDYPFPGREGTALSAVLFLGESSMTVHTYPEFSFVFIDIFHCSSFDANKALDWIAESFKMQSSRTMLLKRGIDADGQPQFASPITFGDK